MLLVGILSAVAFARFANPDIYRQSLFSAQLQSYFRLTQQLALSGTAQFDPDTLAATSNSPVASSLAIEPLAPGKWQITITSGQYSKHYPLAVDSDLLIDEQQLTSPLHFKFASNGDLIEIQFAESLQPVNHSIALHIGDQSICIAPTGYTYEGACI